MKFLLKRILSSPVFITGFAFALRLLIDYLQTQGSPAPARLNLPYGYELGDVARAIAEGRGFSSPLRALETGSTIWFTPIYPYLIAGIFKVWGIFTDRSHIIIQTMNCAFACLTIIPIYGIAKKTFGESVAVGAAWIWVILPAAVIFPLEWVWDTSLIALIFALIFWGTLELREKRGALPWAAYGALWGVGAMVNPSILSLLPFFLGWLAWEARQARAPWIKPVTAALLVFVLCLVPWTVRNYRVFGKFVVLRSNFGLELWLGNNPEVVSNMGAGQHPSANRAEALEYRRMGELAYMAEKEHAAINYMWTHPGHTLDLTLRRFEITWLVFSDSPVDVWVHSDLSNRVSLVSTCLESLLCMVGALFAYRSRLKEAFLFAVTLLVFPLVFYVTHVDARYRFPIDPVIVILGASAVGRLLSLAKTRNRSLGNTAAPVSPLRAV
jgi:4-amino-4-deoxy-L-arabinose transferase-like glycosyltransferase